MKHYKLTGIEAISKKIWIAYFSAADLLLQEEEGTKDRKQKNRSQKNKNPKNSLSKRHLLHHHHLLKKLSLPHNPLKARLIQKEHYHFLLQN